MHKELVLFDIDGTLTPSRQIISPEMKQFLCELKKKVSVGLVGGSDFAKIKEQMDEGEEFVKKYDYVFCENGLVAYRNGQLIGEEDILKYMGEDKLQKFINFCLLYMSSMELPFKRGNFVEFRKGMINICPVGRSVTQKERLEFAAFDQKYKIREKFVASIREALPDMGLAYSIGGQISFDCFPIGWDKSYCLQYVERDKFEKIYFFGDKTYKGGNDYEIYNDKRVLGHTVTCPEDTVAQLKKIFFL